MQVRDLLGGELDTCPPDAHVVAAARRMVAEDVGSLAVVEHGALVGIVTERDVLRAVAEDLIRARTTVADIMTPDPDSLSSDVDIEDACDWMMAAGYRHLPIVDDGELVGMISIKDLMWALTG